MTKAAVRMDYDAPSAYRRLIAPRYAPIADALVAAAALRPGEQVLELCAGTGLVSSRVAAAIAPDGWLCATDLSLPMLEVARESVGRPGVSFALVDYNEPLPFLDRSFDIVLSGLTYVQNRTESLAEVGRVLEPGGRLALAMWGTYYGEVRMMSAARRALGLPPYPSAAPGRAVRRLERAGFPADRAAGLRAGAAVRERRRLPPLPARVRRPGRLDTRAARALPRGATGGGGVGCRRRRHAHARLDGHAAHGFSPVAASTASATPARQCRCNPRSGAGFRSRCSRSGRPGTGPIAG